MTAAEASYPDFSAGEISPRMYGRFDTKVFYQGARRVENFVTQITGPAYYRTGSMFAAKTAGNSKAFLWLFKFTDSLSFVLEFTNQKLRFYRNNGRVTETAQAITGITKANPAVVTYSGADNYSNGDSVFVTGVVGMTEVNGKEFTVVNVNTGANTFELSGINSTSYGTYTSGGEVAVITEITTPWLTAELFDLKFAQKGVDLYVVHPSHNPKKITYSSATSWSIADHSPTALTLTAGNRPSAVTFYEQRLVYGGSTNNPQTLWFSKSGDEDNFTTGTAADDGIQYTIAGDGNTIRWLAGTDKFLAVGTFSDILKVSGGIDDVITPSSISVKPSNAYGCANVNPIGRNNELFYMQRNNLILRSFEYDFQNDGYLAVDRNTVADHITNSGVTQIAFQETRPNILWAVKNNGDFIGMTVEQQEGISGWHRHNTDGDVVSLVATPRSTNYDQLWMCVKRTIEGVDNYYIEYFADEIHHPRRDDYITDDEDADNAVWENLIFESGKNSVYLDSALTYDGTIYGTNASATITPSSTSGSGVTFTASAGVFSATDVGREIWKKCTTGAEAGRAQITGCTSSTVVTCTILENFDNSSVIAAGNWYLTADEVGGLDHLEGKEVSVIADGAQHSQVVVSNGTAALDTQASVVHVGLPYTGYLETNDIEVGGITGPAQTKKKVVYKVGIRFLDTLYAKFGTSYYGLRTLERRTASMRMDRPPPLFSGDDVATYSNEKLSKFEAGWKREKRVIIAQDQPFPCNVQLIIPYTDTSN